MKNEKDKDFKNTLIAFLEYFSENFLKIGNVSKIKINKKNQVIKSVVFSNDDKYIFIAQKNGLIDVHFTSTGELVKSFNDNTDKVLALSFSKKVIKFTS
jgi:sporulation protein YlmC with PRC-barrel domain